MGRDPIPRRRSFPGAPMRGPRSTRYQPRFPAVVPVRGEGRSRVTHPFATLYAAEAALTVRLACVRHAASVHPEPGSNSPFEKALQVKSINVVRPHRQMRAPTYPIHRNRRNSISIRFSVRSIRFSRCGLRAARPSPSRLARAQRQGDTLPPSRARVKGKAALHRDSTTGRGGGRAGGLGQRDGDPRAMAREGKGRRRMRCRGGGSASGAALRRREASETDGERDTRTREEEAGAARGSLSEQRLSMERRIRGVRSIYSGESACTLWFRRPSDSTR